MTKDEAIKQALEALKRMKRYGDTFAYRSYEQNPHEQVCDAITALEALAEPAQQCTGCEGNPSPQNNPCALCGQPAHQENTLPDFSSIFGDKSALAEQSAQKRPQNCGTGYCSCIECVMEPAQRTWVGLTDEDINGLVKEFDGLPITLSYAIEAKLKEKNT